MFTKRPAEQMLWSTQTTGMWKIPIGMFDASPVWNLVFETIHISVNSVVPNKLFHKKQSDVGEVKRSAVTDDLPLITSTLWGEGAVNLHRHAGKHFVR